MEEVVITVNDAGQRLDKFLAKTFPNLKKSAMYKAIRDKKIKVNRKRAAHNQMLEENDHLLLFLKPDFLIREPEKIRALPSVDVVYEDNELIALNKPQGLLSVKDSPEDQDTLNDRLLYYLVQSGQYDPQKEQSFRPALAHRLDRNTSGLVLAGKTAQATRDLARAIHDRTMHKSYLAITRKRPVQGRIELYLKKEGTKALVSSRPQEGYDPAIMTIHTLKEQDGRVLSQIELETGRFHQIRACLAYLKTPLLGDVKYGDRQGDGQYALQAFAIDLKEVSSLAASQIELPSEARLTL